VVGAFWSYDEVDFHKDNIEFDLIGTILATDYLQESDSRAVFGHAEWQLADLAISLRWRMERSNILLRLR